ncbi:MAG: hypothetical protein ABIR15_23300 [Chitinophagaceae bacterium]
MKKLLLALCLGMTMLACSKNGDSNNEGDQILASQVPSAVMNTYNTKYPTASGQIEWELEHGNTYKVKFFIGAQRWQARFTTSGILIDEKMI